VALSGVVSSHTESIADLHNASSISAMTGYEIAQSSASVLTTDTLLQAIAKLEKRIQILEGNANP
jgi:hypothetical protein